MKKEKLNLYIHVSENSGVGLYRQYLPAWYLREEGHANVLINDFMFGKARLLCSSTGEKCDYVSYGYQSEEIIADMVLHKKEKHKVEVLDEFRKMWEGQIFHLADPTHEMLHRLGNWADIIVMARRDTGGYVAQFGGMAEYFNIPLVMDTDDNVRAVRPFNPGYRGYAPGGEASQWHEKAVSVVNAITVSTEHLKKVHEKDNKNLYVLPNSLEFDRWAKAPRIPHEEVRIGILASASHYEDIAPLKDVIDRILTEYPQAHFYCSTNYLQGGIDVFGSLREKHKDRIHGIPWIQLPEWPEKSVELSLDIALAPLADNFFNRGKSNLRFIEYGAARSAPIVSPVEPYTCVKDGTTGLFAREREDWYEKIKYLIENGDKRQTIAENAFKYVGENFDIRKNCVLWLRAYEDIIRKFRKEHGKRKFPKRDILGGEAKTIVAADIGTNSSSSSGRAG